MSGKIENITQNVKGETENMKHKFSNLESNLKDLTSGNIFQQIDQMLSELKRLEEINSKYEFSYFLICTELERRAVIVQENTRTIQEMDSRYKRMEVEYQREIDRIRNEELLRMKQTLESEINNLKATHASERAMLERRIQELQSELSRRDSEIDSLKKQIRAQQDRSSTSEKELKDSITRMKQDELALRDQMAEMKSYYEKHITTITTKYNQDLDALRRQLEEEKYREIEKTKTTITTYYTQQMAARDQDLNQRTSIIDQLKARLAELERENTMLRNQLDQKSREASDFKDQLIQTKRSHDEYIIRITETHKLALQKALQDKDKELKERLEAEVAKLEKDLREKKSTILALEQKIIYMEKENQRTSARLNDMTVERDELKSKLLDAEKRLQEELRIVEETLTIELQDRQSEIDRMTVQIREMTEHYTSLLDQETARANSLALENEMLKREIQRLKELSEQRNREIEEWRTKYKSYVTGEE